MWEKEGTQQLLLSTREDLRGVPAPSDPRCSWGVRREDRGSAAWRLKVEVERVLRWSQKLKVFRLV